MKLGYLAILLVAFLLIGCASEEAAPEAGAPSEPAGGEGAPATGEAAEPAPLEAEISILGDAFEPADITVSAGATIVWTNNAGRKQVFGGPRRLFSAKIDEGETFSFTFEEAGVYKITNVVPMVFVGTVTVE